MTIKSVVLLMTDKESLFFKNLVSISLLLKKIMCFHKYFLRRFKIKKYYKHHSIIKLHFGCGLNNLEDFFNTDLFAKVPIDITKKLPFNNNSVDLIYSNHVIEHIYNWQFRKYLCETYRILKVGGIHIIATPSLEKLCRILYDKKYSKNKKKLIELKDAYSGPCLPVIPD
jgi:SAM-dependent methyltransferase